MERKPCISFLKDVHYRHMAISIGMIPRTKKHNWHKIGGDMMGTKIIIDSTCDFPDDHKEAREYFDVLPANIFIDELEYQDGETVFVEDILQAHKDKKTVKTAQVSLFRIRELFEDYAKKSQDFIFLSFTSVHSGIYQTATMVAEELSEKYPQVKMKVIDTRGATVINGTLALTLREMDQQGASFEELVNYCHSYTPNGRYYFVLKELDHLVRGGRISKVVSVAGSVLDIKPLMKLEDGQLMIDKKIRTYKRAIKELVVMSLDAMSSKDHPVYVGYCEDKEIAIKLRDVLDEAGCTNLKLFQIGSGLATHLGRNGVGILFMDPAFYQQR